MPFGHNYTMFILPDVIGQDYETQRMYKSLRSGYETAGDQSAPETGINIVWAYRLGWQFLSETTAEQLLQAWEILGGSTNQIQWFEWISQPWVNAYVAMGNGSTTTFDLPLKGGSAVTMKVAGVTATGTFQAGAGTSGADRFVFSTAPANAALITGDFTGRRRRNVRITNFRLAPRRSDVSGFWTATMDLLETGVTDL